MKNIKKIAAVILAAMTLGAMSAQAADEEVFTLTIGQNTASVFGETKESDVQPIIRNDSTMLPARFVAENLGAQVSWDGENRVVTVKGEDIEIKLTIDSAVALVNGVEEMLETPAFIENDRTYTPVRFIAEKLGSTVNWDGETKTVIISKPVKAQPSAPASAVGKLELKDFKYVYEPGDDIINAENNEGSVGGMHISGWVTGPADVQRVLIGRWQDEPFTEADIQEAIKLHIKVWKRDGVKIWDSPVPFEFNSTHPVDPDELGKKLYLLLIGVDKNCDAVGYAVLEEFAK